MGFLEKVAKPFKDVSLDVFNALAPPGVDEKTAIAMIPGVGSYMGQQETNAANMEQARIQMAFQERMSSTAFQRQRADMEAAGINPLLLASEGGASTPAGAAARLENPAAGMAEAFSHSVGMYRELATLATDLDLKDAQTKYVKAQTTKLGAQQSKHNLYGTIYNAANKGLAAAVDLAEKIWDSRTKTNSREVQKVNTQPANTNWSSMGTPKF